MPEPKPRNPIYLSDYRPPDYRVPSVDLDFDLYESHAVVKNLMQVEHQGGRDLPPLFLNGVFLKLIEVRIDGQTLKDKDYKIHPEGLEIFPSRDSFKLEIVTEIKPQENAALEGLYKSGEIFCTQNEPEGFRKITYFLDRSDVMSRFTTTIRAEKKRYPVLLSNGNRLASGDLENGRHFVKWQNPFAMPCYLFALVAGDLGKIRDQFVTRSKRQVELEIYVDRGNESKAWHAMESLKRAMRWDEEAYGLEYDLDIYMIVAVEAFNFGAMENKGLNIFNSQYILADPKTATDQNYEAVQSVVGHEYFHNWTGNRVTCRDWFQITLKEGLTVFREQGFTADMTSPALKRIEDVRRLRDHQFPEDEGPNSHPIRPESYIEINNFYTLTVYEKGAEVIRMIETLIGRENFKKGILKYFELYDGQAVTTEDFVRAMELVSGHDLTQFKNWYRLAGTPICKVAGCYDSGAKRYELTLTQEAPKGKIDSDSDCYYFPFRVGFLSSEGKEIPVKRDLLTVSKRQETFIFENIPSPPVLSPLRGFSAPVRLDFKQNQRDLLLLLAHDTDPFNRYDAAQRLVRGHLELEIKKLQEGGKSNTDAEILEAYAKLLKEADKDPAFTAEMMIMPSLSSLVEPMPIYDFENAFLAREVFLKDFAKAHEKTFKALYEKYSGAPYQFNTRAVGERSLKNKALFYLTLLEMDSYRELAYHHMLRADNMTDEISGLAFLCQETSLWREKALKIFYDKWRHEPLVMNKWFAVQADSKLSQTIEEVECLLQDPAFDLKNPNKVRSLLGALSHNLFQFHRKDGKAYGLLARYSLEIDRFNPSLAAGLLKSFKHYAKLDPGRQALMKRHLEGILDQPGLSANSYEIVSRTLSKG